MSFNNPKGVDILKQWIEEQRCALQVVTRSLSLHGPALFCPACKRELGSIQGKRCGKFTIMHHSAGGLCRLEFKSWYGADRKEAVSVFMQFAYAYRSKESAAEPVEVHDEGGEEAAGEGGNLALGSPGSSEREGGERTAADLNRLLEDAGNGEPEPYVWEEIPNQSGLA